MLPLQVWSTLTFKITILTSSEAQTTKKLNKKLPGEVINESEL